MKQATTVSNFSIKTSKPFLFYYSFAIIITFLIPLSEDLSFVNKQLVRITVLIPLYSLISSYLKKNILTMKFVISFVFFSFWSLRSLALAQRNFLFIEVPFNDGLNDLSITKGLSIGILFIIVVNLFCFFREKINTEPHIISPKQVKVNRSKVYGLLIICVTGTLLLLNNSTYFGNGAMVRHGDGASSVIKYLIYYSEPLLILLFLILVGFKYKTKDFKTYYILVSIALLCNFILGDRLSVVSTVSVLIIFLIYKNGSIGFFRGLFSILIVFAFSFYSISKRYGFIAPLDLINLYLKINANSIFDIPLLQFITRDFTPTDLSYLSIQNTTKTGLLYGKSIYDAFILIIPRKLWPNKPINLGTSSVNSELYPQVFEYTHISTGIIGDFYMNFGVFFIPIMIIWLFVVQRVFFGKKSGFFEFGLGVCYIILCFKLGFLDSTTRMMVVYIPAIIFINKIKIKNFLPLKLSFLK